MLARNQIIHGDALEGGRHYLGIELNEQYIKEIAEPRIATTERTGIIQFTEVAS